MLSGLQLQKMEYYQIFLHPCSKIDILDFFFVRLAIHAYLNKDNYLQVFLHHP